MNFKYFAQYCDDDEKEIWKSISYPQYKHLKETHPTKWEKIKIFSRPIRGTRHKLHIRSNSNRFCFNGIKKEEISSALLENKMTTTHEFIIEVINEIAENDTLNIKIDNELIKIKPDKVTSEKEQVTIYCEEQKRYYEYYPDIIVYFSDNKEYLKKWGGRFAIEVNHTHSPTNSKRKHFQSIGFPLFDLNVTDSIRFKYEKASNVESEKFDSYKAFLMRIFHEQIFLTQEFTTYSNKFLGNIIYSQKEELNKYKGALHKEMESSLRNKKDFEDKISKHEFQLAKFQSKIVSLEMDLKLTNIKLDNYQNMSFLKRLLFLFKS